MLILLKISVSVTEKARGFSGILETSGQSLDIQLGSKCPSVSFWKCPSLPANYTEEPDPCFGRHSYIWRHLPEDNTYINGLDSTNNSSTDSFMGIRVCCTSWTSQTRDIHTLFSMITNPIQLSWKNQLFYFLATQQSQYLAFYKATLDNEKWSYVIQL